MDSDTEEPIELLLPLTPENELKPKNEYMKKVIIASKLINMWPKSKKTFWYRFIINLTLFNSFLFILTFLIKIKMEGKNMDGIAEVVDVVTVLISGCFRYFYIYIRGEKYLLLVYLIHTHFIYCPFFQSKKDVTLEKYYKLANRIILTYGCFTYLWILQLCFMPILSYALSYESELFDNGTNTGHGLKYPVPLKVYVPFDIQTQPNHGLFYFYQSCGLMFFGSIYVNVDSFWYMVILLTIGQLVLVKESIETITEAINQEEVSGEIELLKDSHLQEVKDGLRKCVKHHQFVREFVDLVEDILNPNILVDSLHAIISIAFILLDVTIALTKGDVNKVLYSLGYFTTSIAHMFFFDWLGNELAVKEEELADAVYGISWYRCPKIKPDVTLIIAQSRRPQKLSGGKMYKLSLEFFTSTVRAIFSYFTFLFQMRNGKPSSMRSTK